MPRSSGNGPGRDVVASASVVTGAVVDAGTVVMSVVSGATVTANVATIVPRSIAAGAVVSARGLSVEAVVESSPPRRTSTTTSAATSKAPATRAPISTANNGVTSVLRGVRGARPRFTAGEGGAGTTGVSNVGPDASGLRTVRSESSGYGTVAAPQRAQNSPLGATAPHAGQIRVLKKSPHPGLQPSVATIGRSPQGEGCRPRRSIYRS
jgi:hypothetical protein